MCASTFFRSNSPRPGCRPILLPSDEPAMTTKTVPSIQRAAGETATRREFIVAGAMALGALSLEAAATSSAPATAPATGAMVSIEQFSAAGKSEGVVQVAKVAKSAAEWRAQLSPLAYEVTRGQGTELAFSGEYDGNHADGLYRCVCCDTALYDSKTKYDSGTGWPSFWRPISPHNVVKSPDSTLGMQ